MAGRRWGFLTSAILIGCVGIGPALAHPHVWVAMSSDVVFGGDGLIHGINQQWTFDDGYAQLALDGLDTNGDGIYSGDELEPLTRENIESLKDYEYFTVVRMNGTKQAIGSVTDAGQIYSNDKLQLHFFVPLKEPVDPRAGAFMLKVYDPDFFIDFEFGGDGNVAAVGKIPGDCKLVVKPVPTDAELDQTRQMLSTKGKDWKPENSEDFGAMFAQAVLIACGT